MSLSFSQKRLRDFRSAALFKNWRLTVVPTRNEIEEIDEKIIEGYEKEDEELQEWYDEEYPQLHARRLQLIKDFNTKVARYEKPECHKLGQAVSERLAPELREMIYDSLCQSSDRFLIPHRSIKFFSDVPESGDALARLDGEPVFQADDDFENEKINQEIQSVRNATWLHPEWVGRSFAVESTKSYFEKNEFHFRDARRCMMPFLTSPYPCGTPPAYVIRRFRAYVRCEKFLEWAGWSSEVDEDGGGEDPGPDYKWEEHGVYDKIRAQVSALAKIPFRARPLITLVIITPFGRFGSGDLDRESILLNFEEAVLEAYNTLKANGATVHVVTKEYERGADQERDLPAQLSDYPLTWRMELAEESFRERQQRGQYPRYHYLGEARPPHREALERRLDEIRPQKIEEIRIEHERENEAWKASVPKSDWYMLRDV